MFKWFRKKKTLPEKIRDMYNALPVPKEIENAARLYYEASKGSLQSMSSDDLCGYATTRLRHGMGPTSLLRSNPDGPEKGGRA